MMRRIDWNGLLASADRTFREKQPDILTGLGVGSLLAAVILGIANTPEAVRRLEKKKMILETDELSFGETVKAAGTCYISTAGTAIAGTLLVLEGAMEKNQRISSLMMLWTLSENSRKDLLEKTREIVGRKKTEDILDAVDRKRVDRMSPPPEDEDEAIERPNGERLIKIGDPFGREFFGNRNIIEKGVNKLNYQMTHMTEPYISANEFYREIDGPLLDDVGDHIGWNSDKLIEIRWSSHWVNDHVIRGTFSFVTPPEYGYDRA